MHWPPNHPIFGDTALAPHVSAASSLCPDVELGDVLRHVHGRRMAIQVDMADGPAVLKIFASPRARGNHRRLSMLAATSAAAVVPQSHGCDMTGHVGLLQWQTGDTADELTDDELVNASRAIGAAIADLHRSGTTLDRSWTVEREIRQLHRTLDPIDPELAREAAHRARDIDEGVRVPSHRDFHPKQVVLRSGRGLLIDLDDAAQAPPGLDVGNFLAHLTRDGVVGLRDTDAVRAARGEFIEGYGETPKDVTLWEWLALARLAGLACRRHRRRDWYRALMSHIALEEVSP